MCFINKNPFPLFLPAEKPLPVNNHQFQLLVPDLASGDVVFKGLLPLRASTLLHIISLPFLWSIRQQDDFYKRVRKVGGVFLKDAKTLNKFKYAVNM